MSAWKDDLGRWSSAMDRWEGKKPVLEQIEQKSF
jgi:hypothetical protein